jgi:type IV secretory pathway VirJ component
VTILAGAALLALHAAARSLSAQAPAADSSDVTGLPLRELPTATAGHELVFLITGDGGYAAGDRGIAETFVEHGIPVVVLNSRDYLGKKKTPDQAGADARRIITHYFAAWGRDSVILVGYSRGADMAPFIVTRLPDEVKHRVTLVAMIGLAERASFEFHWSDILKDTARPTDIPTVPELMKLQGVHMLCIYGKGEKHSVCPELPSSLVTTDQHGGKHSLSRADGVAVADRVLRELGP